MLREEQQQKRDGEGELAEKNGRKSVRKEEGREEGEEEKEKDWKKNKCPSFR